ncbi:hypothetical protein GCE9029_04495 [Grimontia celer]|uniref:Uncharacterized protein n=2 Tax=Grimontia celer TaxID=1796497 RepID=A0A128FDK3_9GAMM|nr:hypothetical protein GCE9029_04495 [Grimontia celer]
MDMEIQHFSSSTQQPPISVTPGHLSTEMTGFSDPSHYHIQRMLGEDRRRFDASSNDEWPTSLTS